MKKLIIILFLFLFQYNIGYSNDYIQSLIDAVPSEMGTSANITIPPGVYYVNNTITISSETTINLFGYGVILMPLYGCDIMMEYSAPGINRWRAGGGNIFGFTFLDNHTNHRGNIQISIGLFLKDFDNSLVKDCKFTYINGSAITTERTIKSNIDNCGFHYSGRTSFPTLYIGGIRGHISQSMNIMNCKLEVNYDEPYINMSIWSRVIKFSNNGFESDPNQLYSQQYFMVTEGIGHSIAISHFNRNTHEKILINSEDTDITICKFRGVSETFAIVVAGKDNTISLSNFKSGGGIKLIGSGNMVTCNTLANLGTTEWAIDSDSDSNFITGNIITHDKPIWGGIKSNNVINGGLIGIYGELVEK